jgi:hypothetical protein
MRDGPNMGLGQRNYFMMDRINDTTGTATARKP